MNSLINSELQIDFPVLFGNGNPVEIEIGCGKGKFLLASAEENPNVNFFGLDRVAKWMNVGKQKSGHTAKKPSFSMCL